MFGHGAQLGLGPAPKYIFGVSATPVGSYYKSGLQAVDAMVVADYDRAAPKGVGGVKCAGNYAADVKPSSELAAKGAILLCFLCLVKFLASLGFPVALYLDALEHKYVEEFSTSNFVAISGDGSTFITPKSDSILASITNIMLRQLAEAKGLKVEERPVAFDEIKTFSEVAGKLQVALAICL